MPSISRLMGQMQLIISPRQEILICALLNQTNIKVFFGNGEIRPCTIRQDRYPNLFDRTSPQTAFHSPPCQKSRYSRDLASYCLSSCRVDVWVELVAVAEVEKVEMSQKVEMSEKVSLSRSKGGLCWSLNRSTNRCRSHYQDGNFVGVGAGCSGGMGESIELLSS